MPFEFTSPVGRLVSGDCFVPQEKDQKGNPLKDKNGQPTKKWFFGVAYAKDNPEFAQFYQGILREAMTSFPTLFDQQTGQCRAQNFAFKVIDGDGFDQSGKPWSSREGFAGHYIVRFSSGFPPSCFRRGEYDPSQRITDPSEIKRGFFVRVAGVCRGNGDATGKPGLFMNANMVERFMFGPEIFSGPSANETFGGDKPAPTYMPQGMSQVPLAGPGSGAMPGGMPGVSPGAGMPGVPPMGGPAGAMPGMGGPGAMPGGMPGMQAPITPATPTMGPASQGYTYEQWKAAGKTDAQMIAEGIILAPQAPAAMPGVPGAAMPGMGGPGAMPGGMPGGVMPGMPGGAPGGVPSNGPGIPGIPGAAMPGMGGPGAMPANGPGAMPGGMPGTPVIPNAGFVANAMGPTMGPNSQGYTYEQWKASGYDDAQMRANGIIL